MWEWTGFSYVVLAPRQGWEHRAGNEGGPRTPTLWLVAPCNPFWSVERSPGLPVEEEKGQSQKDRICQQDQLSPLSSRVTAGLGDTGLRLTSVFLTLQQTVHHMHAHPRHESRGTACGVCGMSGGTEKAGSSPELHENGSGLEQL